MNISMFKAEKQSIILFVINKKRHDSMVDWGIGFILFAYMAVYDWAYFARPDVYDSQNLTTFLKILIPVVLLICCAYFRASLDLHGPLCKYYFYGIIFCTWIIIPCVLFTNPLNGFKYCIRFVAMIFAGILILQKPGIFRCYARMVVFSLCLMFIIYITSYATYIHFDYDVEFFENNLAWIRIYAQNNQFEQFRVARFSGFFMEPSNASGYCFCGFCLSQFLFQINKNRLWQIASWACILFGLLCLSIVGYIVLGGILLYGAQYLSRFGRFSLSLVAVVIIFGALIGRYIVADNWIDSNFLRIITGLRDQDLSAPSMTESFESLSSGRISLANESLKNGLWNHPIGIGISDGITEISSSAVLYWLETTGVIGLLLLFLRESCLLFRAKIRFSKDPLHLLLIQAWLALAIQNIGYGTFFTPGYLIMSIAILTSCSFSKNHFMLKTLPDISSRPQTTLT